MGRDSNTEDDLEKIVGLFEDNQDISYQIFQLMPIGICITNPKGVYTDVNATYCDMYGYTRSELIGKSFMMVVPEDYQSHLAELHEQFLEKEFELKGRWKVVGKDGKLFEIITNAAFVYDNSGKEKRKMTLVVKADETETTMKRLKTTLKILDNELTVEEIKDKLAQNDMLNRISSMISVAGILQKSDLTETQEQWVNIIKEVGNDTIKHLSSTKDFQKMELGIYEPEISNFDILNLICNEVSDVLETTSSKNLDIHLQDGNDDDIDPEVEDILVQGDEFYLKHLFQNLIFNAVNAAPDNSTVIIKISRKKQLKVEISYAGVIPTDIQADYFDKFTSEGKVPRNGTGGYVSKLIANVHRGNISFLSNKDDGTTLIVELPVL